MNNSVSGSSLPSLRIAQSNHETAPVTIRHTTRVRRPPQSLPSATSPKWHNRRLWDPLGYFRVRTLANPNWPRDPAFVIRMLQPDRSGEPSRRRDLIEDAIRSVHEYANLPRRLDEPEDEFAARLDGCWDRMLSAIDEFLELRQQEHLQAVAEAGASGRE